MNGQAMYRGQDLPRPPFSRYRTPLTSHLRLVQLPQLTPECLAE